MLVILPHSLECGLTHRPILATTAERSIRVTPRLGLHLDAELGSADNGVLDILVCLRQDDNDGLVGKSSVERLSQICVVR